MEPEKIMLTIKLTASTLDELAAAVTAYMIEFDPYIYGTAASLQGFDQDNSVFYAIMTRNEAPK
jgi:hypothetical protein